MGDAASSCLGGDRSREEAPPLDSLRIHVGVPIAKSGISLVVAAATLHVFEIQDAAQSIEEDGGEFDPFTDACDGIFASYGLIRREDDPMRPWWLCGTPNRGFSERDILQAVRRMGHFGCHVQPIYACEPPFFTTAQLDPTCVAMHAEELGVSLPRDASACMRALVAKHTPWPGNQTGVAAEMCRLERLLAEAYASASKRARSSSPNSRRHSLRV